MIKKKTTKQPPPPMLFDVPAIKKEYGDSTKKKEVGPVTDISNMGLNAVWEGRSKVFKSFSDYIKNKPSI